MSSRVILYSNSHRVVKFNHLGVTNMKLFWNCLKKIYTNKPASSYNLFQNFGTDIQLLWTHIEFICFKIIIPNSFLLFKTRNCVQLSSIFIAKSYCFQGRHVFCFTQSLYKLHYIIYNCNTSIVQYIQSIVFKCKEEIISCQVNTMYRADY